MQAVSFRALEKVDGKVGIVQAFLRRHLFLLLLVTLKIAKSSAIGKYFVLSRLFPPASQPASIPEEDPGFDLRIDKESVFGLID